MDPIMWLDLFAQLGTGAGVVYALFTQREEIASLRAERDELQDWILEHHNMARSEVVALAKNGRARRDV